jgi:hypothetical protein
VNAARIPLLNVVRFDHHQYLNVRFIVLLGIKQSYL